MAHHQKRSCRRRCVEYQFQKPRRRRLIDPVVEGDQRGDAEFGLYELPCLAGAASSGAQNLVRQVARDA